MTKFHIISIRGTHLDHAPSKVARAIVEELIKNFPQLPITFVYETDPTQFRVQSPAGMISQMKKYWEDTATQRISRSPTLPCSKEEEKHHRAMFGLFRALLELKINFIASDLPGINQIPLGDPRAEQLREFREKNMADSILKAVRECGGIIIDFGGCSHHFGIQRHLQQLGVMPENITALTIYSHNESITSEERHASTQSSPGEFSARHPLGLRVVNVSKTDAITEEDLIKQVKTMAITNASIALGEMCPPSLCNSFVPNALGCMLPETHTVDAEGRSIKKTLN